MNKIKAVLFDLDGVLVDACEWHYESLNKALSCLGLNPISREDHINKYNGLPTSVKLNLLKINEEVSKKIWLKKQYYTMEEIRNNSKIESNHIELLSYLRQNDIKIACVTNSIRETAHAMLKYTGQYDYIDIVVTNEDVINNKPNPECYNYAIQKLDVDPNMSICVEDSPTGIKAAQDSVVKMLWKVKDSNDVNLKLYRKFIDENFNTNGR